MLRVKLFDGVQKQLTVYNGQAILDYAIEFYSIENCDEETFAFPAYSSSYLRVFNERFGWELKDISLSQTGGSLIINASALDMTFEDLGNYYFEIGYVQSGGYEIVLMYGVMTVI